jgi:hypothetical protein
MPEFLDLLPYCSLYDPLLVALILASSFVLLIVYGGIGLLKQSKSVARRIPYHHWVSVTFMLCGASHAARVVSMYTQNYWWEAGVLIAAALVGLPTLFGVFRVRNYWIMLDRADA